MRATNKLPTNGFLGRLTNAAPLFSYELANAVRRVGRCPLSGVKRTRRAAITGPNRREDDQEGFFQFAD
jgi:hypothetical protein